MNKNILDLIDNHSKIVVGVSGGVDSMLLLHKLYNIYGNRVVVAHINHGLRNESEEEYDFVLTKCIDYGVKFYGKKLDIESYKKLNKISSDEKAARDLRYNFYREVLELENSNYLFLGHHGDDLVEGVLMRLVSGSSGRGLISMTKVNDLDKDMIVFRPFLEKSKSDIYEEANSVCLEWREDLTNKENIYTRNRYRNNILPLLKSENSQVHRNFLTFSQLKNEEESFFDMVVEERLRTKIENKNGMYVINKDYWETEHITMKRRLIEKILLNLGCNHLNVLMLEIVEEKLGNKKNTDYKELLKGIYLVNSGQNKFYLLNESIKKDLEMKRDGYYLTLELKDGYRKKVLKALKDKKVPLAFRMYVKIDNKREKQSCYDILGNFLTFL